MERKLDELGRLLIPIEMRKVLGIEKGDKLYVGIENGNVYLSKEFVEGFVQRKVNELSRVVIPIEYRRTLSFGEPTMINFALEKGRVKVTKSEFYCIFCASSKDVKDVKGVRVCQACIDEIKVGIFQEAY